MAGTSRRTTRPAADPHKERAVSDAPSGETTVDRPIDEVRQSTDEHAGDEQEPDEVDRKNAEGSDSALAARSTAADTPPQTVRVDVNTNTHDAEPLQQPTTHAAKTELAAADSVETDSAGNVTGYTNPGGHAATIRDPHSNAALEANPDRTYVQGTPRRDGSGPVVAVPDHIAENYRQARLEQGLTWEQMAARFERDGYTDLTVWARSDPDAQARPVPATAPLPGTSST